jgi:hypothetical protein
MMDPDLRGRNIYRIRIHNTDFEQSFLWHERKPTGKVVKIEKNIANISLAAEKNVK